MDFTTNRLNKANRKMNGLFQKMARDGACWTIFGLVVLLLVRLSSPLSLACLGGGWVVWI